MMSSEGWQRLCRAVLADEMIRAAAATEREQVAAMLAELETGIHEIHLESQRARGLVPLA